MVVDLSFVALFYYLSTFINHPALPSFAPYILWPLYWAAQGCVCTGLWVIAHECGHRAFSDSVIVCDFFGLILHSALLVPYHSWRISHRKHHRSTNDMDKDEVFIPYTRSEMGLFRAWDEIPNPWSTLQRLALITKMLLFGWPAYLLTHATGRKYGSRTNHYEPFSPLFAPSERWMIVLSDLGLLAVTATLVKLGMVFGPLWVVKTYLIPYLIVNMWLVMITDLQHCDLSIPHYRGAEWTWLKGALCTLDRDYGFLNAVFHHIGDTHVAHHLFSYMPHYHAQEATRALRPILGKYYIKDTVSPGLKGIGEALFKTTTFCRFVDDDGEVLWFKDRL